MPSIAPMLATPGDHVPTGAEWLHEVKWDGIRVLADVVPGTPTRFRTRNGNDVSAAWPDALDAGPPAARDLLVDGEIIALNDAGLPDFRVLQERMHVRDAANVRRLAKQVPATLMAFDLLRLDGVDLTGEPLERRRELLAEALDGVGWQVPAGYDDGAMLYEATREQGLEGIVSKRRGSRYRPGERSNDWLKFPHRFRGSYVVGGWRPQEGSNDRLAALLVGQVTSSGLLYRGRVGSGIGPRQGRLLADAVAGLARAESPFDDDVPRPDSEGTHWLEPVLVVDVDTHGHPSLGYQRLRQPSYQGLRPDLTPEDLR